MAFKAVEMTLGEKGRQGCRTIALLLLAGLLGLSTPVLLLAWQGQVIDAQSGEPLKEVVVVRGWYRTIPTVAGGMDSYVTHKEDVTDANGSFRVIKYLPSISVPVLAQVHEQSTLFYKPGYRPVRVRDKKSPVILEPIPTDYESRTEAVRRADPSHPLDLERTKHLARVIGDEEQFLDAVRFLQRPPKKKQQAPRYKPPPLTRELPAYRPASEEHIKVWVRAIAENDNKLGYYASRELVASRHDAVPYILPLTDHQDARVRAMANGMLADIGDSVAIDHLCGMARSDKQFDDVLRVSTNGQQSTHSYKHKQSSEALMALGKVHDRRAFDCVFQLYLEDPDKRSMAERAIDQIGIYPQGVFADYLSHADGGVRADIYRWLKASGESRIHGILMQGLEDEDVRVKRVCIVGLVGLEEPSIWPYLVQQLNSERHKVRQLAGEILVRYGERSAGIIYNVLKDGELKQRWQAVYLLAQMDDETSYEWLKPFSDDEVPEVRLMTVYGLGYHGIEDALPLIARLAASDPDEGVRTTAEKVRISLAQRVEATRPKPAPEASPPPPPPPTARETFEAEWIRRGRQPHAANDLGLYVIKLEPFSSRGRSSCNDFDLNEDQLRIYFTKAKMSRFYEINFCSVRGVLRDKGVYKWWIVNEKGYGTMSVDASAGAGQNEGEYLYCEECPVVMNW